MEPEPKEIFTQHYFFFSFSDFGKTGFVKALTTTLYFSVGALSCFETWLLVVTGTLLKKVITVC